MKLVTYNIQYGTGRDEKFDLDRIAASLEGADIIALQEVTRNFPRNGGVDLVAGLAKLLPDYFHVFGPGMDVHPGERDAAGRPANRRIQFGNMVLSRWPIVATRNLLLPRTRRFDQSNLQRAALEALVVTPTGPVRIYSVHLDHVDGNERALQIRHLKERVYAYQLDGGAVTGATEYGYPELPCPEEFVIMGDFNMVRSSPEYSLMTGDNGHGDDHRHLAHHPVDVSRLAGGLPEGAVSWVYDGAPETNRLIDFAFIHAVLANRVQRTWLDTDAMGSDHLPLWFELA
ncbi:endonuclease/exonuclease/phosphatase family protein [Pseudaminobacter sp. NGMCC 1.201702]|uniref:endonuclease/exonuclease/phosphatase family protein n=1 Tax=Pseudaminobacter sp. NGMCC 1.201702 TaxID=3391825 RepID=UPI0039EE3057